MKVLLISANTEAINMPVIPMGLGAVAAATQRAGHDVTLLDLLGRENHQKAVHETVAHFQPQVIGISVRNIDDQKSQPTNLLIEKAKPVISKCRQLSEAPIVLGGAGYSMFPEAALSYLEADMGIQGEGEIAFPLLLDLLDQKASHLTVPGLFLPGAGPQGKRTYEKALDGIPVPDISPWTHLATGNQDLWLPIQTRRGCPMDCSYCSTAMIEGRLIRKRHPQKVTEAISRYATHGFRQFFFVDNTFNIPVSYAKDLCQALIRMKMDISWRCIVYPGYLDEALVKDMARAGCKEVSLGFESGCDRILQGMNKKFSVEAIRQASDLLAKHGIARLGFLLLGGPGETKASVKESLAFADSLHLEAMKVSLGIRIYPDTLLARQAIRDNVIHPDDDLLFPRFYLVHELEDWLHDTIPDWMASRPSWMW